MRQIPKSLFAKLANRLKKSFFDNLHNNLQQDSRATIWTDRKKITV